MTPLFPQNIGHANGETDYRQVSFFPFSTHHVSVLAIIASSLCKSFRRCPNFGVFSTRWENIRSLKVLAFRTPLPKNSESCAANLEQEFSKYTLKINLGFEFGGVVHYLYFFFKKECDILKKKTGKKLDAVKTGLTPLGTVAVGHRHHL